MRIEVDSTNNAKGELALTKFRMDGVYFGVVEILEQWPGDQIGDRAAEICPIIIVDHRRAHVAVPRECLSYAQIATSNVDRARDGAMP
jgi:hypothetical protein